MLARALVRTMTAPARNRCVLARALRTMTAPARNRCMLARAPRAAPSRSLSTKKSRRYDKVYELTARGEACACTTRVRQHTIRTDTPKLSGGADAAAQPVELLLAALVGCETATAHFVARGVR